MKLTTKAIKLLASPDFEGTKLHVYKDSGGLPTIGRGHLLTKSELRSGKIYIDHKPVRYASGLTQTQADDLLAQDLYPIEDNIGMAVKNPLNQAQFTALVFFAFNVGINAFDESTLLKVLNAGRYELVPDQLRRWVHDNGKVVEGLKNRREKEIAIWNGKTDVS